MNLSSIQTSPTDSLIQPQQREITAIHQFSFACSDGDGVTNSMLYIRKLVRQMGFDSEIFSETIPDTLRHEILDISVLKALDTSNYLLFSHHCMGYDRWQWLIDLPVPKVMIYHNITPVDMLPEGDIRRWAELGREQLRDWAPHFSGAIGVSEFNTAELAQHKYANLATIPLLVDTSLLLSSVPDVTGLIARQQNNSALTMFQDAFNVLFVGRISENKQQLDLVEMIYHLKNMSVQKVRLILAGGISSHHYWTKIEEKITQYGLQHEVLLTGKVSLPELAGLYSNADAFVCMSAHEGFGMPLIEAMLYDLPVVARESSNLANTMGQGGLLLAPDTSPYAMAVALKELNQNPAQRRQMLAAQQVNLQRFSEATVSRQLCDYLNHLGLNFSRPLDFSGQQEQSNQPAAQQNPAEDSAYWQIEGPFDSNYSLAIVNRELALALHRQGIDTGLRSHEGHGDFAPSAEFLAEQPLVASMHQRAVARQSGAELPPQVALRFCYPPHLDAMPAACRVVHSYGWEETGFPLAYVEQFNRRLDLLSVLSESVAKTMLDNGVRVPVSVTAAGVDHLLKIAANAEKSSLPAVLPEALTSVWKEFRFLHISSCFPRKGVDVLLRAYGQAFSEQDEVTLVIKTFPNPHNDVAQQLERLKQQQPDFPQVIVLEEDLSQEELIALYQSCHTLVAPSRGEGFGLPMAEAMCFDLPVITTGWGGQTDFCTEDSSWLCDYQFASAKTHLSSNFSLWAEPSQSHLVELMHTLYRLTAVEKRQKTDLAKARVLASYSWDAVAQRMIRAVAELPEIAKPAPKIGWLSTWNARCGIASYSQFLVEHFPAGRCTVLANHIPERTGFDQDSVIRCWTAGDAEQLDEAFEIITETGMQAVVIQYNFGFYTLAALEKLILRLKQAGIGIHIFFHSTADVVLPGIFKSLGSIASSLALADRLYVHGVDDVNRLKGWNLIQNVCYFPHGIASQNQLSVAPKTTRLQQLAELSRHKTIIASYGYLLPHKGIKELIEAFALLAGQDESLHLLLLNALYPVEISKEIEWQCRDLIARLDLNDKVTFNSAYLSEAEITAYLQCADLIVFPYQSTQESSSAAVRSGIASGSAVAVTPLAIFDDVADAVVKLEGVAPAQMARSIAALLSDQDALQGLKQRASQWSKPREWRVLSQRLLNIIDSLAR